MTALYLLGAILIVLVLGVMVAPLFREEGPAEELESLPPAERREAALEAVGDLRFEHETGKMSEEEYRRLRTHFGRVILAAEEEMEATGEEAPAPDPCPECGETPDDPVKFCPKCGARQPGAAAGG